MNRALLLAALASLSLLAACNPSKDSCPGGLKCGDRCLDGTSDPQNCGACGNVCGAGTSCCGGTCVDTLSSEAHCGGCGHACPVDGACNAGTCECPVALPTACGTAPGACVDLTVDPANCGTCGAGCAGPGVAPAPSCASSACVCAGTASSTECGGSCVNTDTDERNCGGCSTGNPSHVCKTNAVCTGGACGCTSSSFPDSCPTACVNLLTDRANCGSCGIACAGTCSNGICCQNGQTNCSGSCVNTQTSDLNCGSCGHACAANQHCVAGSCGCPEDTRLCGATCCAGNACCGTGGTQCQTAHSNGLGDSFFDCNPLYAPSQLTLQLAQKAADARGTGSDLFGLCGGNCLGRQFGTACAIWCYAGSAHPGRVTSGVSSCSFAIGGGGLCANFPGTSTIWQ